MRWVEGRHALILPPTRQSQLYYVAQTRCRAPLSQGLHLWKTRPAHWFSCLQGQFSPLPQVMRSKGAGGFICPYPGHLKTEKWLGQSSLTPCRIGSAVLSKRGTGVLSRVCQLVRRRASSPELMTLWAAFLTARGGKEWQDGGEDGGGGRSPLHPCHPRADNWRGVSAPVLTSLGLAQLPPAPHQFQLHLLSGPVPLCCLSRSEGFPEHCSW